MALPVNGSIHLITAYYSFYRPRKDERPSWPSWLTYSGWLTHISGHPSAAGRAQDRESSPTRDRRSTTVPRQPTTTVCAVNFGQQARWAEFCPTECHTQLFCLTGMQAASPSISGSIGSWFVTLFFFFSSSFWVYSGLVTLTARQRFRLD